MAHPPWPGYSNYNTVGQQYSTDGQGASTQQGLLPSMESGQEEQFYQSYYPHQPQNTQQGHHYFQGEPLEQPVVYCVEGDSQQYGECISWVYTEGDHDMR